MKSDEEFEYIKYFSKMTMKIPFSMKKLDEMLENVT